MRAVRIRLWEIRTPGRVVAPRSNNHLSPFKLRPPTPGLLLSLQLDSDLTLALAQKEQYRSVSISQAPSWAIDYATWPFEVCLQILISMSRCIPLCTHLVAACFNVHKLKTARFLVILLS
jgi:hypothetical protein